MRKLALVGIIVSALFGLGVFATPAAADEALDAGKAFTKLARGVINVLTGWVEIPRRIHETTQASGASTGFTWGTLRGFGHGFIRTTAGFYEIITFPFPAPSGYAPVLEPEYVFTTETSTDDSYDY